MKKLVFIISLAIVAISCGEKKDQKSELTGSISIDGSGTVFPVSEAVAEEFLKVEPKVRVTVGESGTGGGFKKFGTGVTDISAASRDIKGKEIELCEKNGIEYLQLTVALDGLGYVYFILGDKTKAIEVWQRLHIAMGNNEFAEYLGKNTFEKSMRFMLEKTKNDNPLYCSNPTILAIATSLIEDKEQTLNYLDIAFKYRHEDLALGLLKPHFLSYHSNERFKTIAQNMGVHISSNFVNNQQ